MRTNALNYHLPEELIATHPAQPRDRARLMLCNRTTGRVTHHHVHDLPELGILTDGDLLVANRSRVLPARFTATRAKTGGKAAGLYLGEADGSWRIMLETRGKPEPGESIALTPTSSLTLTRTLGGGEWEAKLIGPVATLPLLEKIGANPLPPYIRKARKQRHEPEEDADDHTRYNTVYAKEPGSVAAPTAGLHFTPRVLEALEAQGIARQEVVLHVGPGTFAPVRTTDVEGHDIHEEFVTIPAQTARALREIRQRGRRALAVGTTTVRAIESLPENADQWAGQTKLFITPDRVDRGAFQWRHTDLLMTNFHLPKSTLLALVAALPGVGLERLLGWYRIAIDERYRFYSYGDAMLIH